MGIMLAEPNFHTRCYVEWEEYPRSSIIAGQRAGYLEPAPIWDDVTTFDAKPYEGFIDTILAGYPCQPFSQAGQRKGENDERHLWPDIARIIQEIKPTWIILENVAGHITLGLEAVLRELRNMGFTVAVSVFTAAETGATHERKRIVIVAHSHSNGQRTAQLQAQQTSGATINRSCDIVDNTECNGRNPGRHGHHRENDRHKLNAAGCAMAHPTQPRSQRKRPNGSEIGREKQNGSIGLRCGTGIFPPTPNDKDGWADVIAVSPDFAPTASIGDIAHQARRVAQMVAQGDLEERQAESYLRRMVDGLAQRAQSLKLCGNGVHPLAIAHAWRTLSTAHGLRPLDLGTTTEGETK